MCLAPAGGATYRTARRARRCRRSLGDNAPTWIVWTAKIFPVKHFAGGIQASYVGTPFHWIDVVIVAIWGIAGLLVAVRYFTWEPRV